MIPFEIEKVGPRSSLPKLAELKEDLTHQLAAGELVSLVILDLDGSKAVNDRLGGHQVGDHCLDEVVATIGTAILRKGQLYRFRESDEFAVVLRNATVSEASATAERIRNSIEQGKSVCNFGVTASIGVACSKDTGLDTPEELQQAGDKAMYASKFTGTLNPTTMRGGAANSTATVTLNAPAVGTAAQRRVTLSSSNTAAATVPSTVTVPAGATTATFTVTTHAGGTTTTASLSATLNGGTQQATLIITP